MHIEARRSSISIMTTRITVSLPEKEYAALAALAKRHDVSLSWLTRKAVIEFLRQQGEGNARLVLDLPPRTKAGSK